MRPFLTTAQEPHLGPNRFDIADADWLNHLSLPFGGLLQQDWTTDSSLIRQELRYKEPVSIAIALERTLDWERQNPPTDIQHSASAMVLLTPEIEDQIVATSGQ